MPAARLRRSTDIAAVRAGGRSVRSGSFALRVLATPMSGPRLLVSAPRTLGGAVRRNRARRRLREAFRQALSEPYRMDLMVTARPEALVRPFASLVAEAAAALGEAAR